MARRWAREHTPLLAVMYTPRVCASVSNVVRTRRPARASRMTLIPGARQSTCRMWQTSVRNEDVNVSPIILGNNAFSVVLVEDRV
jgi:hypothetical protein